ncbi:ubiquinol-cytochrome C chaperone family protein [Phreatobacter sp.]|uniref:ubiquinol-cytochrome C chaperone family protein n=1 Tax=Phreatobacter sp. TaxID=1966341 RepID=UPI0022C055B3|nr:ubiquinol-cytochrome C chaperone family protein [Phreatobacter sp.]MCZ8314606.1 ubiquinol-cytochrome C chaperone [Phreatobacter sp.]
MILGLFRRKKSEPTIDSLYGTIVAQAREPVFYTACGVPDTLWGRFEMVVLHAFLVLHRLKGESEERRELGQALFDRLFLDFDRGLREVGVSDTKVPRKIRQMGEAFYGRVQAYDEALAAEDPGLLEAALARNVLASPGADTQELAAYMRRTAAHFAAVPYESFLAGEVAFPPPPQGDAA